MLRADPAADTVQPGKPPINKCEHLEFTRVSFRQRRVVQTRSAAETEYKKGSIATDSTVAWISQLLCVSTSNGNGPGQMENKVKV